MMQHYDHECYECRNGVLVCDVAVDVSYGNELRTGRNGRFRVLEHGVCFSRLLPARPRKGQYFPYFDGWFLSYDDLTWKTRWGSLEFAVAGQQHSTIWFSSSSASWDKRQNLIDHLTECRDVRYPAYLERQQMTYQQELAQRPQPRLIRTAQDGEQVAADWLAYLDGAPASPTPMGADSGIDAYTERSVARVKMEAVPTGRPAVQMLYGLAAAVQKEAVFFSLAGYTAPAVAWADDVGLPLFRFDLQGVPEPVNRAAQDRLEVV